jgi:hypothetical protein
MMVELVSVLAVFAGGCLALRAAGLRGWALPPLGLLAGIFLQLGIGLIQVVAFLPTSPALTLALVVALPATWWALRRRAGHDVTIPVPYAMLSLAAVGVAVAVFRAANLVRYHTDSMFYLTSGALLADGSYRADVTVDLLTTRGLGVPLLHAPANLAGPDLYLRSVTPLLGLATLAALVWLFTLGARELAAPGRVALIGGLGALLLVTNNRYVFSLFYLNGHLLFAAQLLIVVGAGWLLARDHRVRTLRVLQLLAIPALIVTRPEGFLVAVLALLPTWLSVSVPVRYRATTVLTCGASALVWHAFMGALVLARGGDPTGQVVGGIAAGALVLCLYPLRHWGFPLLRARSVLLLVEAGLWLALLGFAVLKPGVLRRSLAATYTNLVHGNGRWGYSLVVLGLLVLGGWALASFRHKAHLRFPLTTFAPLAFLLAYLREGAYRVGFADSLSRMFMQYVPLALLFVMAAVALDRRSLRPAASPSPPSEPAGRPAGARQTVA